MTDSAPKMEQCQAPDKLGEEGLETSPAGGI